MFFCPLLYCGCVKKLITLGSTGVGAGVGSLAGPTGATAGGMLGYAGAELVQAEIKEDEITDTITAAAVQNIVTSQMGEHRSEIGDFKTTIQKILSIAGVGLALYLLIPLFVARYTAKQCVEKSTTRAPFPKPSDKI